MTVEHRDFEWDDAKAQSNLRKHGIRFDDAPAMLAGDSHQVTMDDLSHSEREPRWITLGAVPIDDILILMVVWTTRGHENDVTRIISARRANTRERECYEKAKSHS